MRRAYSARDAWAEGSVVMGADYGMARALDGVETYRNRFAKGKPGLVRKQLHAANDEQQLE
jgi:hypothetical protein